MWEREERMKLSIVVPCYNEEENIPLLLKRFEEVIKRDDMEVILVDNGSTDGSARVLSELVPGYAFARTVSVEVNQGYGYGILQGLKECRLGIDAHRTFPSYASEKFMRICRQIPGILCGPWS